MTSGGNSDFRHQLRFGDRKHLGHLGADHLGRGFAAQIGNQLAHDIFDASFFEIGADDFQGIGRSLIPRFAQQVSGPKADQLVAARLGPELHLGVMGEFVFKSVFAIFKGGHGGAPWLE